MRLIVEIIGDWRPCSSEQLITPRGKYLVKFSFYLLRQVEVVDADDFEVISRQHLCESFDALG